MPLEDEQSSQERWGVRGAEALVALFGYWPSFQDAEVLRFSLLRADDKEYPQSPTVECLIHVFEIDCAAGSSGESQLTKHTLVTLRFFEVVETEVYDFNHQNALWELEITAPPLSGVRWPLKYAVRFKPTNGMEASFACSGIEVVSALPCDSQGRVIGR